MERYDRKVVVIVGAGDLAMAVGKRILSEGGKIAFVDSAEESLQTAEMEMNSA